ncbi:MAG: hypothetical protein WC512_05785 [Candidatus Omnitrophota bacterium]
MKAIKFMIKTAFLFSVILFAAAFAEKDKLPPKDEILPELYSEPAQKPTNMNSFSIKTGSCAYTIEPKFDYELYGLVVSYHHSSVFWDMEHKQWQDYLNNKDMGVVWGSNISSGTYLDMKFTSGSWTLYWDFKWGTPAAKQKEIMDKFDPSKISNNHILPADDRIAKLVMSAERGDQIWMKGYLVNYTTPCWENFWRASSTTRDDTGSHACEVVYVTDFKILRKADQTWRAVYELMKFAMPLCLVLYIIVFSIEAFTTGR